MRERIAHLTVDELLQIKAETLWEGTEKISPFKEEKLLKDTLYKWGIKIAEKGVDIKRVDPPREYSEALARQRQLELEAEARRRQYEIEAEGRAAEIIGTVINAVVKASGRKREEVEKEFQANPEEFYRKHRAIFDNTMTKLSMEEGAYLRIETPGATGALGDLLRLVGAWQRMPKGKERKRRENSTRRISDEEHRKIVREAVEEALRKHKQ
jgi:regulator of protease activity HflC (stomatin/prohibitin superfamily)